MRKYVIGLLIVVLLWPVSFVKAEGVILAPNAKSSILLEASTGEILYENNSHERLHPASMTKMMSMLLIIEHIEKGVLGWDDIVTVSAKAASMGGSQILLEENEQMSVRDLFKGIAVASGNDAVVALAEKIGGTEEHFVSMMNERAIQLGLQDTNFKNPHGLDAANHYSSAYDMAMIAKELVKHEEIFEYTSIYEDYLRRGQKNEIWLVNTNKLVRFYQGVDGLKTGYTEEAGYCLTATAKKDNMRIIAVAMGEPDSKTRNKEITEMLDYAYAQYSIEHLLSTNSVLGNKSVAKGVKKTVGIVPMENVTILNQKMGEKKTATYDLKVGELKAPLKKGDVVGTLDVKENDQVTRTISVTVNEDVEQANIFQLYWRYLTEIFTGDMRL